MSAHVLLNLSNRLRKSCFRNKFDKFNNTGARMIDYIYHKDYFEISFLA